MEEGIVCISQGHQLRPHLPVAVGQCGVLPVCTKLNTESRRESIQKEVSVAMDIDVNLLTNVVDIANPP